MKGKRITAYVTLTYDAELEVSEKEWNLAVEESESERDAAVFLLFEMGRFGAGNESSPYFEDAESVSWEDIQ